jgi:hypothetical protein
MENITLADSDDAPARLCLLAQPLDDAERNSHGIRARAQ